MAPGLGRPASHPQTRFPTHFLLQVPGAAPLPTRGEKGGVGAGRWVLRPGLPAGPWGGRGILGAARCSPRRTAGRRAPSRRAEMRAETLGTSRARGLQTPNERNTRSRRGLGFVPGVPSAVCPPRRGAPVSAAQTLFAACSGSLRFLSRCAFWGSLF